MTELQERFWEIDLLRGIAIVMMVAFHLAYDLKYFNAYDINLTSGSIFMVGRVSAILFIVLAGISLTLSHSRKWQMKGTGSTGEKVERYEKSEFARYAKRGLRIFFWGMLITGGSYIFLRDGVIVFGILHFIGIGIILAYPFLRFRTANLILALPVIATGLWMQNITFEINWFFWAGLRSSGFHSYDYFPLLPWFGILLIGIFLGNLLYPDYKRAQLLSSIPDISGYLPVKGLCYMGRRSLLIYLLHQPILVLLIYITGIADIGQLSPIS
ncbi:heparan-alpha-glucosaminide N-acetyltransferase [Methanococcoides sp. LMO-2]|uniref:Heparan-alpha-glucosaminide N-acetyltransferase n=1 Tax=Methanococcoides cohabitans TaxID=3136559 RepID=A0ABU9KVS4_9EURY